MTARGISLALLRVLLWGSTAALALALVLAGSARGTAFAARALQGIEPRLTLEHRDGNLLEARFDRIAWRNGELSVTLSGVAWTLAPRCLLTDSLCFARLGIAALDIDLGPASDTHDAFALAPVTLPVPLEIDHGTLDVLRLHRGTRELLALRDITLAAGMHGSRVDISRLDARQDELYASLSGRVSLRDQLPLEASGRATWRREHQLGISVRGDLARLVFEARTHGALALDAEGEIDALAQPAALRLRARSREPVAPYPGWPGLGTLHEAQLTLEGSPDALRATLAARLDSPALGANTLAATAGWIPGQLDVSAFELQGAAGRLDATAQLQTNAARRWRVQARAADFCPTGFAPALSCALSGAVTAEGALGGPTLELALTGALAGRVNGLPARIEGRAQALPDASWRLDGVRVQSGANRLALEGTAGETLQLDAALSIGNLADTIATARGSGSGTVALRGSPADPQITGMLNLQQLQWGELGAEQLDVEADWRGLAHAANRVKVEVLGGRAAGVEHVRLEGRASGSGPAHDITLEAQADAHAIRVACRGALAQDRGWRGACAQLQLDPGADVATWRNDGALALAWQPVTGTLSVDPFCLRSGAASLCSTRPLSLGRASIAGLAISGTGIPFALLAPWLPEGFAASGEFGLRLNADKAAGQNPRVDAGIATDSAAFEVLAAGEPLRFAVDDFSASARSQGAGIALDWRLALQDGGRFSGDALVQDRAGTLSGRVELRDFDLAPFALAAPGVVSAAGTLGGDVTLAGSLREPRVSGVLRLRDGKLAHAQLAQPVEEAALDVEFSGAETRFIGSFATAGGTGSLDGSARFGDADWRAELALKAENLQIEPLRDSRITVAPDLKVLLAPEQATVSGEVLIPTADIRLDRLPETAVSVSPDAVIVGEEAPAAPFAYTANVRVRLGEQVRLRGRGVDARLAGTLDVTKQSREPARARGDIQIPEGRYAAYGQQLEVTEGSIRFRGPLDRPDLRLTAVRRIEDEGIVVGVRVRGDLREPQLSTYSRPAMEESRALHYLLTGRAPDAESNSELAVAGLLLQLGTAGASKLTGSALQRFGVEDFQLATRQVEGGTEVHLSGYLTPDLYLRYGVSTFDRINTFRLRYRLRRSFYVEATSGIENAVDFLYSFER